MVYLLERHKDTDLVIHPEATDGWQRFMKNPRAFRQPCLGSWTLHMEVIYRNLHTTCYIYIYNDYISIIIYIHNIIIYIIIIYDIYIFSITLFYIYTTYYRIQICPAIAEVTDELLWLDAQRRSMFWCQAAWLQPTALIIVSESTKG